MNTVQYPIKGACQCGGVTYELLEPPVMIAACHCKECQKLSTSAFSITAMVKAESIKFKGLMNDWRRVAENGNVNGAKFCPTCSNRLYHFNPNDPQMIKLKPGTLLDTSIIKPTVHIWVSEKQDWFEIPKNVESFDKQPQ